MALPNSAVKGRRDNTASVLRRFGDEQSTLLDRFERLSFEAHLNRAMLPRSLSDSSAAARSRVPSPLPMSLSSQVCQGRRGSGLNKILKKLLKPIKLCRRKAAGRHEQEPRHADPRDPCNWKAFSRRQGYGYLPDAINLQISLWGQNSVYVEQLHETFAERHGVDTWKESFLNDTMCASHVGDTVGFTPPLCCDLAPLSSYLSVMDSPISSGTKFRSAFLVNLIICPTSSARVNLKISERSKPVFPAALLLSERCVLAERDSKVFCKYASTAKKEYPILKETISRNNLRDLADEIRKIPVKSVKEILVFVKDKGGNLTLSDLNDLLSVLITLDEKDLALELYSYLPSCGLTPDCRTFSLMIRCHCKSNELDEAKRILDEMLERGYHPNVTTFTVLIDLFCKKGKLQKAFDVFHAMGKIRCEPTIRIYNHLLKGLCYVGRVEEAYEKLKTIRKNNLPTPDMNTYTIVMDGFSKVGRSDEAMELLDEAIDMGLEPGAVTYNTLFDGYCREGRPMKGFSLLKLMKQRNCTPDSITYNTFLNGLLKWGKIREGLCVQKDMEKMGLEADERIMGCLFRGLCRKSWEEPDLVDDAHQLFDKMTKRKMPAVSEASAYSLLIRALCVGGRMEEALRYLDRAIELGLVPRTVTFNNLIERLSLEGRMEEALTVLSVMFGHGKIPNRTSYQVLIKRLNRRGMSSAARTVYGAALKQSVFPHGQPQS